MYVSDKRSEYKLPMLVRGRYARTKTNGIAQGQPSLLPPFFFGKKKKVTTESKGEHLKQ